MADFVIITHPAPTIADRKISPKQWATLSAISNNGGWQLKEDVRNQSDKKNNTKTKKPRASTGSKETGRED